MLILDEVTSEIDVITETDIIENLIEVRKGKTTVIVAHRLPSIRNVDEIVFMGKNGIIQGTHEYLLSASRDYSEMWAKS